MAEQLVAHNGPLESCKTTEKGGEKRLRRSQIFIARVQQKPAELRRNGIFIGTAICYAISSVRSDIEREIKLPNEMPLLRS